MYHSIFDSHSHYTDAAFATDRDALLQQLPAAGISYAMLAGSSLLDSTENVKLSETYPYLYAAVGVHPEYAATVPVDYLEQLRTLAKSGRVRAIGEIGLDYHYPGYDKKAQQAVFGTQLALAADLQLPVIVHCRDAAADCMTLLREYKPEGVLHCFSGSAETAKEVLNLGMYIGFTGVLTFKNAKKALAALAVVPPERLLLETDCPYMAPEPYRGQRCDSRMIPRMAERVAACRGCEAQEILQQTCENAKRLFRIAD